MTPGEVQPIASSSSEVSLASGAGQYDMDTPTDGMKCLPGSSLGHSNHGCTDWVLPHDGGVAMATGDADWASGEIS